MQRVPSNDVRIQTSAASVVVLPEAEELDVGTCVLGYFLLA